MALYEWACHGCGERLEEIVPMGQAVWSRPCRCGDVLRRVLSAQVALFRPHFNQSLGAHVSSRSAFKAELRRKSEEATEATGIKHSFVEVGPSDIAHTVTDEGMESTRRAEHAAGKPPKRSHVT